MATRLLEAATGHRLSLQEPVLDSLLEVESAKTPQISATGSRLGLHTAKKGEKLQLGFKNKQSVAFAELEDSILHMESNGKKLAQFNSSHSAHFHDFYVKHTLVKAERMKVNGFNQWQIYSRDSFEQEDDRKHWNDGKMGTTKCGGVTMLGGPGKSGKERLTRKFEGLPAHK